MQRISVPMLNVQEGSLSSSNSVSSPIRPASLTTLNYLSGRPSLNVDARNFQTLYQSNLVKAQAQLQTQQINAAIQLLKAEYNALMKSILSSDQRVHKVTPLAVDQTTFTSQFELPAAAESVTDDWSSLALGTKHIHKRSYSDDGIKSVLENASCRIVKSDHCHGTKRTRME